MKKKIIALFFLLILAIPCFALSSVTALADNQPLTHTVTFMVDGENFHTMEIVDGKKIMTLPETPLKNGSIFKFWGVEVDGQEELSEFSFVSETITKDITLIAQWNVITKYYKVTFKVNGEVVNVQEVEQGKSAVAPASPELPIGKELTGWDTDFDIVTENLTVNAILSDKSYDVTIYKFNGEEFSLQKVTHGQTAQLPSASQVPTISHYTFIGFDYNNQPITQNTKIKMIYQPNEYTVTFENGGTQFSETQNIKYGGTVKFPLETPVQGEDIFVGWYVKDTDTPYDFHSEIQEDLTLVAKFVPKEKPKYNVTFYTHDGIMYGGTQKIEEGRSAIQPGDPTRYGYEFAGWSEDFSYVTSDLEIYPIYIRNNYKVKFYCDGELLETQTVAFGDSATQPTTPIPEIEGYDFIAWDRPLKNIEKNTEIHAIYRIKSFAVMFYDEHDKIIGSTQYVEYGKSAKEPKLNEKVGYTFDGWSDGKTTSKDAFKNITKDVTFIAQYTAITYSVNFFDETGLKETKVVNHGYFAPLYTYTNGEKIFIGWYVDDNYNTLFDFATPITNDVNLYAKWEDKPATTYIVSFKVDGQVYFEYMVKEGQGVMAPGVPEKTGCTFKGWEYFDKELNENVEFNASVQITDNVEVNAVFETNKYTVTFYYGQDQYSQVQVEYGNPATAPDQKAVEIEGYEFISWSQRFDIVTNDLAIYANYEQISVSITFINGNDQVAVQSLYYGEYAKLVTNPTKTGYTFAGWYIDKEFTTPFDFNQPVKQVVKVYANFTVNEYSIIYYLDGVMHQTILVEYDTEIIPLADPEFEDDRIFLGWSEIPERMPAQTVVVVGSTKYLGTYVISYYVNSTCIKTVEYKEGQTVTSLAKPTDLPETVEFLNWINEPTEMPAYNVTVHAKVNNLSYYNLYYYVNGQFNISQMVLQGKPVTPPDRPQGRLPDNIVFNGWLNVPETMPTSHIRIDADITVLETYTVRYYIDGNARFVQQVIEGKEFKVMQDPSNALQDDVIFNYWTYDVNGDGKPDTVESGAKLTMPSHDIEIHANITKLKYYNVKYYIGDLLYFTRTILQGKQVTPFNHPSDLPETIIFYNWVGEPTVMPEEDVIVTANYKKLEYYTLSFYVGNRFYSSQRTLEGATFSLPEPPTNLPENIVFNCWVYDGNFVMPSQDLTIYADYRELQEYTITYYINGQYYWSQSVLEGKKIEVIDPPVETPDNIVFLSWGVVPEYMPAENISISAEIKVLVEYELNYYVNGVLYRSFKVLEGKEVTPLGEPYDQPDYIIFNGWVNEPTIMPSNNVNVYADVTILSANIFEITFSEIVDGKFKVTVEMTGLVNFAGFLAEVVYDSDFTVTSYWYDENGYTYGEDNHGKIVWSKAVNTTEQIKLLELEFDVGDATSVDYSQVQFTVYDIVVIDDTGNVVTAEYSVEYKNK